MDYQPKQWDTFNNNFEKKDKMNESTETSGNNTDAVINNIETLESKTADTENPLDLQGQENL